MTKRQWTMVQVALLCASNEPEKGWSVKDDGPLPSQQEFDSLVGLLDPGTVYDPETGPSVEAEVHSDDHVEGAKFDAAPWFFQASDEEILALAECDWGGNLPADRVALFMEDRNPAVEAVFDHVRELPDDRAHEDLKGFECHVDEGEAKHWLAVNKPELLRKIDGEEEEEADEEEVEEVSTPTLLGYILDEFGDWDRELPPVVVESRGDCSASLSVGTQKFTLTLEQER